MYIFLLKFKFIIQLKSLHIKHKMLFFAMQLTALCKTFSSPLCKSWGPVQVHRARWQFLGLSDLYSGAGNTPVTPSGGGAAVAWVAKSCLYQTLRAKSLKNVIKIKGL